MTPGGIPLPQLAKSHAPDGSFAVEVEPDPPHVGLTVAPLAGREARGLTSKRVFDIVAASAAILLAAPLLVCLALLVKLTSRGPVIFWQRRLGLNGETFRCYKFRTMTANAQEILKGMLEVDSNLSREFQQRAKLKDDPRLTRYGRLLRRSSLDELPQLFNVLRGEMSLVGPRPLVPEELIRYGPWGTDLLSVRPGITGLWQVSGRNNLSYTERIEADMSYIGDHSLRGDLTILCRTVAQMFRPGRNGAY